MGEGRSGLMGIAGLLTLRVLRIAGSRLPRGRVVATLALTGFALVTALAVTSGPALASTGHKFLSQLKPGTPFVGPEAMTSDKAGNTYVADGEAVDVFDSSGKFVKRFGEGILGGEISGIAVDSSGKAYVADLGTGTVDVFKPSGGGYALLSEWTGEGTTAGAFGEVGGIAIDNSTSKSDPSAGDVYVLDRGELVVDVFQPQPEASEEAKFLSTLKGKFEEPSAIAVNSGTGQVYVGENTKHVIDVFPNATGKPELTKITGKGSPTKTLGNIASIAIEEPSGDVYVVDDFAKAVDQFTAGAEWRGWITGAASGAPLGEVLHVASAPSGEVYVADFEGVAVDVYAPGALVATVATSKATKITRTTATLNGTVTTESKPTKYHFEYGEPGGPLTSTTPTAATEGTSKVLATASGLKAGSFYQFRVVAEDESGTSYGAFLELETPPAVTGVSTLPASNIEPTTATLNGSLEPEALKTKYHFEYGETTTYGKASPEAETEGTGSVPASAAVTGLKPNTPYHFRLVAANEFGTTDGADSTFKTSGPPSVAVGTTTPIGHTTATVNAQINPGKLETKYHVTYGTTTCEGASTPEAVIPPGESPAAIKVELTGLKLATTYHFCVVASNKATEPGPPVVTPEQEFTTVLIESESAKEVKAESAVLQTQINPLGVDTKYHFEYGETASYGTSVPVPDEDLGNGTVDKIGEQTITGLQPSTTYHYRVVATVEGIAEKGLGADRTFTTPATSVSAFKLPDGRGYEMVSPPNKRGGFIEPLSRNGGAIQASVDGSSLAYIVDGPIVESPEGNRSPEAQQVISTRGQSEWSSQEIVTPHERAWGLRAGRPPEYQFFSPDLSIAFVQPFPYALTPFAEPALSPPALPGEHQEKTMYLRTSTGYLPLVTAANVAPGTHFGGLEQLVGEENRHNRVVPDLQFLSASPDLSHVVFRSGVALSKQEPSAPGLYEWSGGELQLVSVLPSGKPAEKTFTFVTELDLGYGFAGQPTNYRHAISNDGSRVVWTLDETSSRGLGHLYVRDTTKQQTVQLDAPEEGLPIPTIGEAQYQTASADGSKIFFTDPQALTTNSTAAPGKADLYECEVTESTVSHKLGCNLTDLTVDHNGGESAAVQGAVLGSSEDGSYVYFVATGVLASGGQSGANNLYVAKHEGTAWATRFVARLSTEDKPDWLTRGRVDLVNQTTRVSPSGRYLAFMSNRSLTGYNNTDVNEETGQHADEEVFLFDASTQTVTCPSCNPSGARPRGVFDTQLAGEGAGLLVDRPETWTSTNNEGVDHWLAGSIPGWTTIDETESNYQSRYLSDSGRLFFTSADPLVPEAVGHVRNETVEGKEATVGVENVYEFQPNQVGSCTAARGCVALISNAASNKESAFLDASTNGNDVFFVTAAKVLPQDEDSSYDIYDARVCGEAGCQPVPTKSQPPCNSTEECRGAAGSQQTFGTASSSTFSGPGNTTHLVPAGGTLPAKVSKPAPLTNAQKLAMALKKCRKLPHKTHVQKKKRANCESSARKKYGAKKATKKASRSSRSKK